MNCRVSFLLLLVLLFACSVLYNCAWFNVSLDKKPKMLSYLAAVEPIYKAEWKPGLRHKLDLGCEGMNARTKARKLHFVFQHKVLNSPNVLHSFKNKIIEKNVTIFGDSMQLGFFKDMYTIFKICERKNIDKISTLR